MNLGEDIWRFPGRTITCDSIQSLPMKTPRQQDNSGNRSPCPGRMLGSQGEPSLAIPFSCQRDFQTRTELPGAATLLLWRAKLDFCARKLDRIERTPPPLKKSPNSWFHFLELSDVLWPTIRILPVRKRFCAQDNLSYKYKQISQFQCHFIDLVGIFYL